jgi:hypothetical protein
MSVTSLSRGAHWLHALAGASDCTAPKNLRSVYHPVAANPTRKEPA